MYLLALAGKYPVFFFAFLFGSILFQNVFSALKTWSLGYWAQQYDQRPAEEVDVVL
jgi:hypothetical protein